MRKHGLPPVVDRNTQVLILGSLPGDRSLARQEYYAHPRNLFWHLVGVVTGCDLAGQPYADRLSSLLGTGIGMWDVIGSGRRSGSLDAAIREPHLNPLTDLIGTLPHLRAVAFNGKTAARAGERILADAGVPLVALPSSSPAYAAMPLATKEKHWLDLKEYLGRENLETPRARDH